MVVSRKRVLRAIYRGPRTSRPAPEHRIYPYLLAKADISLPNQAWAADITYLPMARGLPLPRGHHGLAQPVRGGLAVVQLFGGRLLRRGLAGGTDQGSQFTSGEFIQTLQEHRVKISMDGKGRYLDTIFVERPTTWSSWT